MDATHSSNPDAPDAAGGRDDESVAEVLIEEVIEKRVDDPAFELGFAEPAVETSRPSAPPANAPDDDAPSDSRRSTPPRPPRRQATVVKKRKGGGNTSHKRKSGVSMGEKLGQLRVSLSGLYANSRRSPVLRIMLILTPVALTILISYAGNAIIFGATNREIDAKVIDRGSDGVRLTINGGRITVPLPGDYNLISVDQYYAENILARAANTADGFTPIAVAKPESSKDAAYFLTVAAIGESWQNLSERDFRRLKSQVRNQKEIRSSFAASTDRVLDVENETEHSLCFGRVSTTGRYGRDTERWFFQLSCLLLYQKRAIVLNCGAEYDAGESIDQNRVRTTLLDWRRQLIGE